MENVKVQIEPSDIRTQVLEIVKANKEIIDIGEAKVIVSGGRGVGSEENFESAPPRYLLCIFHFQ